MSSCFIHYNMHPFLVFFYFPPRILLNIPGTYYTSDNDTHCHRKQKHDNNKQQHSELGERRLPFSSLSSVSAGSGLDPKVCDRAIIAIEYSRLQLWANIYHGGTGTGYYDVPILLLEDQFVELKYSIDIVHYPEFLLSINILARDSTFSTICWNFEVLAGKKNKTGSKAIDTLLFIPKYCIISNSFGS